MKITRIDPLPKLAKEKRVAAYARVSVDNDAMRHSLAAQVSYYSKMIQEHPGWQYAGVYADEGISGTKDNRPEFQRLLADCRAGKIDMIITKSVSRFARNTVTHLQTIRELKSLGIDVYYEEMNLHTMDEKGELLISLLASMAQEESRSASENLKWRIRKSYEKGELLCWNFMYGYRISKQNGIQIDPETGPIAKEIFKRVAEGASLSSVMHWLNRNDYCGALGGKWKESRLRYMLSNEKYLGDALLQKTYINNHLEKKKVKNQGELQQYYLTQTHPALIDQDTFQAVQKRLAEIAEENGLHTRTQNEFSGMIRCPNCERNYKRVQMRGIPNWACPTYHTEGKVACESKRILEETLIKVIGTALQIAPWAPEEFKKRVETIIVIGSNTLELHLKDGTVKTVEWQDRSRSESWTPEMREQARECARRRNHG